MKYHLKEFEYAIFIMSFLVPNTLLYDYIFKRGIDLESARTTGNDTFG